MNYQLRRMKRKTVGIYITKEGEIEVRAPRSVSEAEIDRLRKQRIFPSMERAFCCPICRRQSCAPPLWAFTAKRQKPFCQVRWIALPHSLERPPSRCASPRPKRAGVPARQKAGSIFPGASCARRRKQWITLSSTSLRI